MVLVGINGFLIFELLQRLFFNQSFESQPKDIKELFIGVVVVVLVSVLFVFMRLETQIKEDGVYYRFFPFQLKMKTISWDRISEAFIREYKPLIEYGGWGIRLSLWGKGWAFNVSGNKGLQLVYDNDKKFLLGTQKPEALQQALVQLGRLSNEATN